MISQNLPRVASARLSHRLASSGDQSQNKEIEEQPKWAKALAQGPIDNDLDAFRSDLWYLRPKDAEGKQAFYEQFLDFLEKRGDNKEQAQWIKKGLARASTPSGRDELLELVFRKGSWKPAEVSLELATQLRYRGCGVDPGNARFYHETYTQGLKDRPALRLFSKVHEGLEESNVVKVFREIAIGLNAETPEELNKLGKELSYTLHECEDNELLKRRVFDAMAKIPGNEQHFAEGIRLRNLMKSEDNVSDVQRIYLDQGYRDSLRKRVEIVAQWVSGPDAFAANKFMFERMVEDPKYKNIGERALKMLEKATDEETVERIGRWASSYESRELNGSMSAAESHIYNPTEEISTIFLEDLKQTFPSLKKGAEWHLARVKDGDYNGLDHSLVEDWLSTDPADNWLENSETAVDFFDDLMAVVKEHKKSWKNSYFDGIKQLLKLKQARSPQELCRLGQAISKKLDEDAAPPFRAGLIAKLSQFPQMKETLGLYDKIRPTLRSEASIKIVEEHLLESAEKSYGVQKTLASLPTKLHKDQLELRDVCVVLVDQIRHPRTRMRGQRLLRMVPDVSGLALRPVMSKTLSSVTQWILNQDGVGDGFQALKKGAEGGTSFQDDYARKYMLQDLKSSFPELGPKLDYLQGRLATEDNRLNHSLIRDWLQNGDLSIVDLLERQLANFPKDAKLRAEVEAKQLERAELEIRNMQEGSNGNSGAVLTFVEGGLNIGGFLLSES